MTFPGLKAHFPGPTFKAFVDVKNVTPAINVDINMSYQTLIYTVTQYKEKMWKMEKGCAQKQVSHIIDIIVSESR